MSLHNKYPSYFYKRGNLFNTYLGHTDAPTRPAKRKSPPKRPRKASKEPQRPAERESPAQRPREASKEPQRGTKARRYSFPDPRPLRPNVAAEKLVDFASRHLSADEARRLLQLISEANGLSRPTPGPDVWSQLAYAASVGIPQERVERYLAVLEDRQRAGRPLIQR